ncbi:hypothetical protein MMC21_008059 [Puttea exsequens]|nr:hypothetical protein [Puttea exsequens]
MKEESQLPLLDSSPVSRISEKTTRALRANEWRLTKYLAACLVIPGLLFLMTRANTDTLRHATSTIKGLHHDASPTASLHDASSTASSAALASANTTTNTKAPDEIPEIPESLNRTFAQLKEDMLHPPPYPPLPPADDEEYMAICLGVRDPDPDIKEWFTHYYHHHGIRRFYVVDDGSEPPLKTRTDLFDIPSSAITWDFISRESRPENIQKYMFKERCTVPHRTKHVWMGYLDADEFIQMRNPDPKKTPDTLKQWLQKWEADPTVGAVAANWIAHNSAGLDHRPATGPRKAFTRCVVNDPNGENKHVKMFAKLADVTDIWSVHHIGTREGTRQVGEHGNNAGPFRTPITHDFWAIHHYGIKSREQFEEKYARNKALDWQTAGDLFDRVDGARDYECLDLVEWVP